MITCTPRQSFITRSAVAPDDLLSFMLRDWPQMAQHAERSRQASFPVPITVRETAEALHIEADLPGVRLEDVDVTLDRGVLTLKAVRTLSVDEPGELKHNERSAGELSRSIAVGRSVDADRVSAQMRDGVLSVTLPKAASNVGRKINVTAH